MTNIIIKSLYKITADSSVLNDVDKMVIDFDYEGEQRRVAMSWQEINNDADLKAIMKEVIKSLKPKKQIVNLTEKWKGEYTI